jgi:hypothetical protein
MADNGKRGPRATTPEQASQHLHQFKCLVANKHSLLDFFFISGIDVGTDHLNVQYFALGCLVGVGFVWTWSLSVLEQNLGVCVRVKVFFLIIY